MNETKFITESTILPKLKFKPALQRVRTAIDASHTYENPFRSIGNVTKTGILTSQESPVYSYVVSHGNKLGMFINKLV